MRLEMVCATMEREKGKVVVCVLKKGVGDGDSFFSIGGRGRWMCMLCG
jgi:hypothetical protein